MRGVRAFIITALCLGALPARAQAPTVLDCTGPFAKQANLAAAEKAFGAENVRRGEIYVGEGATETGTLVFADDPKRRIEILWHDTDRQRRPALIRVGDGSEWRVASPGGQTIAIGAPLAEVEKLNGKPFTLSGFSWDYGGYVTDWKKGKLTSPPSGCHFGIRFEPDPKASEKAQNSASGDTEFSSASTAMRAVRPFVSQITLGWAE
ncbi:hypothetical protein ABLE91_10015 [Aquabacter sp. CN5-332]|uniref:hypothetical protein n=1 Tax=Aquabacter sp. CN5-332 TaxID=3156608 RepID=UPI0032B4FBB2